MKRSILNRFARFSVMAFAIAICASLLLSFLYGSDDIVTTYHKYSIAAADNVQATFDSAAYDDIVSGDERPVYEQLRSKIRAICSKYGAEYMYIFEVDPTTTTRTFLFCVANDDDEDQQVMQERSLGSQSTVPLAVEEADATKGIANTSPEIVANDFGCSLSWYYPFEIAGCENPLVLGIDFDAAQEQEDVVQYAITFTIPMVIVITIVVAFELMALKKSVSDPLRALSTRMRSFTEDGVKKRVSIDVSNTAEIADIEDSFNKMSDDINGYVERIAKMREERASAETELEVARRIQLGLVPPTTHCAGDGFDAYAFERAARAVGGDFYDLAVLDDGRLLCVIADVSGKGVSAALFMAMFRTLLRDSMMRYEEPARALNEANDIVAANNPENMFVTLIAALYDPKTHVLTYANAGHTPPLVVGSGYLSPDYGIALGLFEDAGIVNETLVLEPGQSILFYTDGTTEAVDPNDQFFGEERLAQAVQDSQDAQSVVRAAIDAVDSFAGPREQFDDLTLLALVVTETKTTTWQATLEPSLSSFPELRDHILEACGESTNAKQAVLACDEAFANVASYSGATSVEVDLHAQGNELVVRLSDDGIPFDPLTHESEELSFEDFDMGGMGIMLFREAADDIAYEYANGKNILTLRFSL